MIMKIVEGIGNTINEVIVFLANYDIRILRWLALLAFVVTLPITVPFCAIFFGGAYIWGALSDWWESNFS